jgi:glyoxylase-like metal-dependent hydrolase (beta-lactamase superfamily II)
MSATTRCFKLGGLTFRVLHAGPAHTPEDLMMLVEEDGVLFVGDLMFSGRIPFVGDAQVASWIAAIERVMRAEASRRRRRPRPGVAARGRRPCADARLPDLPALAIRPRSTRASTSRPPTGASTGRATPRCRRSRRRTVAMPTRPT